MSDKQKLHEKLTTGASFLGSADYYQKNCPDFIAEGLNPNFGLRPYQKEAFGRFAYYTEKYPERPQDEPLHLLFHMATGSGKTLVMAGLMLYLYDKGYRNFVFFVNSTTIIKKTKENFLNAQSVKYLFADTIQLKDRQIAVREVHNLSEANPDDINILFTTIQGLHSNLNEPRENMVTYEDFEDQPVVFLSDEAHHINAETKKDNQLNMDEQIGLTSWENSVKRIFRSHKENVMLEFTATMDMNEEAILEKYHDKILFDYSLKSFREDRYSKEVKLLQSDADMFQRTLQAMLLSQFRLKVFGKHRILIKPVLLLKSEKIAKSTEFYEEFHAKLSSLTASDLEAIKSNPNIDSVLAKVFGYFAQEKIALANIVSELKEDFSQEKSLIVNSKEESEDNQIAVNTLEDPNNQYRVIFAVDKLNEGWDVLNLFDIVRLYDKRDAKAGKPGKTTVAEAQLIGRGARYCPFVIHEDQPLYQRKYDVRSNEEEEHELKICEELYYHSTYNPRYIDELNRALEEAGIKAKRTTEKQLKLKEDFLKSTFYKTGLVFINERKKYNRLDVHEISTSFKHTTHGYHIADGFSKSSTVFEKNVTQTIKTHRKDYVLKDFGKHLVRKALSQFEVFQFQKLKEYYPNFSSMTEFIESEKYLGNIKIEFEGTEADVENLTNQHKLKATVKLLEKLAEYLHSEKVEFKGGFEFKPFMIKDTIKDKTLNFALDEDTDKQTGIGQSETTDSNYHLDISQCDWYVFNENYGTTEEKGFVKYIDKVVKDLQKKFDEVYLVRNERHFQIYNFDDGKPFEPDFVLFLKKESGKSLHYQVFIEPKGSHLLQHDEWKENLLKRLKDEHKIEQLWENKEFTIWGMPFFNMHEKKAEFEAEFTALLK